jgi:multiple sugar transport system substrate-binding protein
MKLRGITWDDPRGFGGLENATRAFIHEFNYDVDIEWDKQSLYEFTMRSPGELAKHYDLVIVDYPSIGDLAMSNEYIPIDSIINSEDLIKIRKETVGKSLNTYIYKDHVWALPIDVSAQVSAYRPDLLSEVPRSIISMLNLARKLYNDGACKIALSLTPLHAHSTFLSILANIDRKIWNRHFHEIDDSAIHKALSILEEMGDYVHRISFDSDPIKLLDYMATTDEICYAPYIYGYFNYSRNRYRSNIVLFSAVPSSTTMPIGAVLGGAGIAVSRRAEGSLDIIRRFLLWLLNRDVQINIYFKGYGQPSNIYAWIDENVNLETNDAYLNTLSTVIHAYPRPNFPGFTKIHEESGKIIQKFLSNNEKIDITIKELKTIYRDHLSQLKND